MEHPIINPPNPYVGVVRIFVGTMLRISGKPKVNATRFAINFQTGPSLNPRDDLALHLSPCFTPPRVIRNTLRQGVWGLEESWGKGNAISPHQPFEIIILAEQEQFKVAINGVHFCEFRYRIPYQEITHLTIDGDVDIDKIIISSYQQPSQQSAYQPTAPSVGMPMPTGSIYPTIPGNQYQQPTGPYPSPAGVGPMPMPTPSGVGPMPTPSGYMNPTNPYPSAGYPQAPHMGGPSPAGSSYQPGYPGQQYPYQQPQTQPGNSKGLFGNLPIGGLAATIGAGLGAAALLNANPLKKIKKLGKHKGFKKGWNKSSSSSNSSISSRSSFSSNSS